MVDLQCTKKDADSQFVIVRIVTSWQIGSKQSRLGKIKSCFYL